MKRTHLIAVLVGIVAIGIFAADAQAFYHPGMGVFTSRDPGAGAANRIGAGGAAPTGQFVPRDQYRDGMNLYQYVRSNPVTNTDPSGAVTIPSYSRWSKAVASENDVTAGPDGVNDAYNLRLMEEKAGPNKGTCTLYVHLTLQFQFSKGTQAWRSDAEKKAWMASYVSAVESAWSNKHTIARTSDSECDCPCWRGTTVRVIIKPLFEGSHTEEHWELSVRKIAPGDFWTSSVYGGLGNVYLDSEDLVPKPSGQRGAVHEFGHMLGLKDEYAGARGGVSWWTGDTSSAMNNGEDVRPRHYTPFSEWMTSKVSRKGCKYAAKDASGKEWSYANAGIH